MEIVLAALVVVALIAFFFLKKKPAQAPDKAHLESKPLASQTERAPSVTSKKSESSRPKERTAADQVESLEEALVPSVDPADSLAPTPADYDSIPSGEHLPLEDEDEPRQSASPPPPPARGASAPLASIGRKSELQSLRKGLAKSRDSQGFFGRLKGLLSGRKEIDPEIAAEIEEVLLTSDVGVETTEAILERIKGQLDRGDLKNEAQVWEALRDEARRTLSVDGKSGGIVLSGHPTVVLLVGVNGAGKTTTIGKLAKQFNDAGKKVMLAAGDTFRAAAVDQLKAWGERVGCEVISGKENADPSSVLFDAIQAAKDSGADVLLADTAGRLHTKTNLMLEMSKIYKTASKALDGAPHEVLLVIDSTNGQNAMAQAREFKEALNITGLVLTKLDGTARGGAVLGICDSLQLPVRYIGVGERTEDLYEFDTNAFVEALLGADGDVIAA